MPSTEKELMDEPNKRSLGTKGKKAELAARLQKAMEDKVVIADTNQQIPRQGKRKKGRWHEWIPRGCILGRVDS